MQKKQTKKEKKKQRARKTKRTCTCQPFIQCTSRIFNTIYDHITQEKTPEYTHPALQQVCSAINKQIQHIQKEQQRIEVSLQRPTLIAQNPSDPQQHLLHTAHHTNTVTLQQLQHQYQHLQQLQHQPPSTPLTQPQQLALAKEIAKTQLSIIHDPLFPEGGKLATDLELLRQKASGSSSNDLEKKLNLLREGLNGTFPPDPIRKGGVALLGAGKAAVSLVEGVCATLFVEISFPFHWEKLPPPWDDIPYLAHFTRSERLKGLKKLPGHAKKFICKFFIRDTPEEIRRKAFKNALNPEAYHLEYWGKVGFWGFHGILAAHATYNLIRSLPRLMSEIGGLTGLSNEIRFTLAEFAEIECPLQRQAAFIEFFEELSTAEQSQLLQECVTVSEVEEFVPIMEEGVEAVEALETAEVMEEGAEAVEALEAEEVMVEGVGMVEAEVEEFEAILKEIPQTLNEAAQARHIPTGSGYKPGRSVLTADPEILLEGIHAGKYKIIRIINEHKVTVEFAEEIGYYYSKRKLPQATRYATIHYGAEGAHIVPANPNRKIP